jgi:hypothetical protein
VSVGSQRERPTTILSIDPVYVCHSFLSGCSSRGRLNERDRGTENKVAAVIGLWAEDVNHAVNAAHATLKAATY